MVTIRLAEPRDVDLIHASIEGLARHVGMTDLLASTPANLANALFGDDPPLQGIVAELASEYAGMSLFFRTYSTWFGRVGVYVQDIFVEPRFRGRGVGDSLLRQVAALTRAKGAAYLRLTVDARNHSALRFYQRMGLEHTEADQSYAAFGPAFDALADAATLEQT
jgi:ribosomal protein S18 acetylase RimI-like enzyme